MTVGRGTWSFFPLDKSIQDVFTTMNKMVFIILALSEVGARNRCQNKSNKQEDVR